MRKIKVRKQTADSSRASGLDLFWGTHFPKHSDLFIYPSYSIFDIRYSIAITFRTLYIVMRQAIQVRLQCSLPPFLECRNFFLFYEIQCLFHNIQFYYAKIVFIYQPLKDKKKHQNSRLALMPRAIYTKQSERFYL